MVRLPEKENIEKVVEMKKRGIPTDDIVKDLRAQGLSYKESEGAMAQADLPAPAGPAMQPSPQMQPSIMEQGAPVGPAQPMQQAPAPAPQQPLPPPQPQLPPPPEPTRETREPEPREEPAPEPEYREAPQPQFIPTQPIRSEIENVEILIENIVEEKFQRMLEAYGDIGAWKEKVRTEVIAIKQELLRIRNKLENTERAILGRVTKYDKDIVDMGSEVKALEKVLQNILKPLTSSVKELQSVTKKLKK